MRHLEPENVKTPPEEPEGASAGRNGTSVSREKAANSEGAHGQRCSYAWRLSTGHHPLHGRDTVRRMKARTRYRPVETDGRWKLGHDKDIWRNAASQLEFDSRDEAERWIEQHRQRLQKVADERFTANSPRQ